MNNNNTNENHNNNFLGLWLNWTISLIFEKIENLYFSENNQKFFAYVSFTKYLSKAVLCSKRTGEYLLSPHKKIVCGWLSNKATKMLYFESFEKNTQLWAYPAHPWLRLKHETQIGLEIVWIFAFLCP